jgi:hypothetical protein
MVAIIMDGTITAGAITAGAGTIIDGTAITTVMVGAAAIGDLESSLVRGITTAMMDIMTITQPLATSRRFGVTIAMVTSS